MKQGKILMPFRIRAAEEHVAHSGNSAKHMSASEELVCAASKCLPKNTSRLRAHNSMCAGDYREIAKVWKHRCVRHLCFFSCGNKGKSSQAMPR